jgi:NADH-quinone oxidoreductase subunit L
MVTMLAQALARLTSLDVIPFAILLFPLAGFVVLAFFGGQIRKDREEHGAGVMACATVVASFLGAIRLFVLVERQTQDFIAAQVVAVRQTPYLPNSIYLGSFLGIYDFNFIDVPGFFVPIALLIDRLTVVMVLVVTGVGALIHIYSLGYMAHDPERVRFFSYLNLFTFFMLLLVMAQNLPLMFIGWEGVGLCSYLLIGFWFKRPSAADAGQKAFIVNRIGDAGLILGMVLCFQAFGTVDLLDITKNIGRVLAPEGWGEFGVITAVALLLFLGACGKSAQVPLHVWLPDAMEGPTPVSALIHAATMVTAGVYMVVRLAPLYRYSAIAMTVVMVVGITTALMAATVALVQTDIKKVLAYSTISQLGFMFLACGVGAFGVAIFHLTTHAFFKALLFLGAGSVIHALSGEQDLRRMGGLWKRLPWTFGTFVVGTAAIAGVPFFAGFFSKDEILAGALAGHHTQLFLLALFAALLTAFYMSRLVFLAFAGSFRGGEEVGRHIHESPPVILAPLALLAVGSIVTGYIAIPHFLAAVTSEPPVGAHVAWLPLVATLTAAAGIVAAAYLYGLYTDVPARIGARFAVMRRVLEAKYGFDNFFNAVARRGVIGGSRTLLWQLADVGLIDGAVNGSARLCAWVAQQTRLTQTGLARTYALATFGGAVALLAYLLWAR